MTTHTAIQEPAYRKRIGYQSMLLASICCLVSAMIVVGNTSTKAKITEALKQDQLQKLEQVMPAERHDNVLLDDKIIVKNILNQDDYREIYVAKKNQKTVGYAYPTQSDGYSGTIYILMGITAEGEITGVRVISHGETPGLGDKIEIAKHNWILGFNGLSLSNTAKKDWAVKKDGGQFDQFTGATITPRAVVKAVYQGLEFFSTNEAQFTNGMETSHSSTAESMGSESPELSRE